MMITGEFRLKAYDGISVKAYFAVNGYYADEIIGELRRIGARGKDFRRSKRNLRRGVLNEGLTYFNPEHRSAVVVTQLTTSAAEFFDSLLHEIRHLTDYIAIHFGYRMGTEDVGYLQGAIAKSMFRIAKSLLCEHCRRDC